MLISLEQLMRPSLLSGCIQGSFKFITGPEMIWHSVPLRADGRHGMLSRLGYSAYLGFTHFSIKCKSGLPKELEGV